MESVPAWTPLVQASRHMPDTPTSDSPGTPESPGESSRTVRPESVPLSVVSQRLSRSEKVLCRSLEEGNTPITKFQSGSTRSSLRASNLLERIQTVNFGNSQIETPVSSRNNQPQVEMTVCHGCHGPMGNGQHNGSAPGKNHCLFTHSALCRGGFPETESWRPCPDGYVYMATVPTSGFETTMDTFDFRPQSHQQLGHASSTPGVGGGPLPPLSQPQFVTLDGQFHGLGLDQQMVAHDQDRLRRQALGEGARERTPRIVSLQYANSNPAPLPLPGQGLVAEAVQIQIDEHRATNQAQDDFLDRPQTSPNITQLRSIPHLRYSVEDQVAGYRDQIPSLSAARSASAAPANQSVIQHHNGFQDQGHGDGIRVTPVPAQAVPAAQLQAPAPQAATSQPAFSTPPAISTNIVVSTVAPVLSMDPTPVYAPAPSTTTVPMPAHPPRMPVQSTIHYGQPQIGGAAPVVSNVQQQFGPVIPPQTILTNSVAQSAQSVIVPPINSIATPVPYQLNTPYYPQPQNPQPQNPISQPAWVFPQNVQQAHHLQNQVRPAQYSVLNGLPAQVQPLPGSYGYSPAIGLLPQHQPTSLPFGQQQQQQHKTEFRCCPTTGRQWQVQVPVEVVQTTPVYRTEFRCSPTTGRQWQVQVPIQQSSPPQPVIKLEWRTNPVTGQMYQVQVPSQAAVTTPVGGQHQRGQSLVPHVQLVQDQSQFQDSQQQRSGDQSSLSQQVHDRVAGIVSLMGGGSSGKKQSRIIDFAKKCPAKWAKSTTMSNINLPLFAWGAISELEASMSGRTEQMQEGELVGKLRHIKAVMEVCCLNTSASEFSSYGWSLAKDYSTKVEEEVEQKLASWLDMPAGVKTATLVAAQMDCPRSARSGLPQVTDKTVCLTYNKCSTDGKCQYEVENPTKTCQRKHECSWCREHLKRSNKHQSRSCKNKEKEG